jgi:hypothetical protein
MRTLLGDVTPNGMRTRRRNAPRAIMAKPNHASGESLDIDRFTLGKGAASENAAPKSA